ncbi:50S ribosomal protein L32 [Desulfonatronum lacustre]|uniref:50S ribosomal protein L32 n=1 Tax=Desulfonatronum lacustre TaxID=66849 RepID=UPI00048F39C7|nr:50S ribosomal protein L32 [Desulfonatronum lacustre]SMP47665.1 large subunit ribosomal protein L32 [Desulfonatronum zhilinae]
MALPKKKTSRSKRGMRRSHDVVAIPNPIYCECGELALSHRICSACGSYKGVKRIAVQEPDAAK